MEKKITLKENFERLAGVVKRANIDETEKNELLLFINNRIEQINKKASGTSAKEKENKALQDQIKVVLLNLLAQQSEPINIATMLKVEPLSQYTNQRISAILTKLIAENKVERTVIKKVPFFAIAKETETTEE